LWHYFSGNREIEKFEITDEREAMLLALQVSNHSLEPSKELSDKIRKNLALIRKTFPGRTGARHSPGYIPNQLLCNELSEEEFESLNDSEFGPCFLRFNKFSVSLSFEKLFNLGVVQKILVEKGFVEWCELNSYMEESSSNVSYCGENTFKFHSGYCNSPDGYFDEHFTIYKVENGKAIYVGEYGNFVPKKLKIKS